jgi:hypothetical protein
MSFTVSNIISKHLYGAIPLNESGSSLSVKPWTDNYLSITTYLAYEPTKANLDVMFHELDVADTIRLAKPCHDINETLEVHHSEGDTVASWHVQVAHPVSLAFQENPCLIRRAEAAPPGSTSSNAIIDHYLSLTYKDKEYCIISGELKRWGVIDPEQWRGGPQGALTKRLGKELRG